MLTKRQKDCLLFIQDYQKRTGGVSPLYDEIKAGLSLANKSNVHRLVSALEERGFLRRIPAAPRSIQIIRTAPSGKPPPPPTDNRIPIYRASDHKIMGYLPT